MHIPVVVEQVNAVGYRARSGEPLAMSADGPTADKAVENLQRLLTAQVAAGSRLVSVEVPTAHSWAPWAGMFKDDPWFEACRQAITDRRKEIDEDPSIP